MADVTLDVAEIQLLVNYPNDPGGFLWHHRILLHRIEGSTWLCLTPDHDIVRYDLNAIPHRILGRRTPFPDDIADEVYAHDVVGRSQLLAFKRQAKLQAVILGEGEPEESEAAEWVIVESSHPDFGSVVGADLLNHGATGFAFSTKGVVLLQGEEIFVERVPARDMEDWKRRRGLENADLHLLGGHKDAAGKRRLDLNAAVSLMKGTSKDDDKEDFPISGVRAAREYHESIAMGPGNFVSYIRLSGVGRRSLAAHIHRSLCECLRLMHSYNQLDASTTAVGEFLSPWAVQTELAIKRSPTQPDYTGLDIIAGASVQGDGRASTARFGEWISARLKERAQIWKHERLYAQEKHHLRARRGGGRGAGDQGSEDGDGKKAKKKKGNKGTGGKGASEPPAAS